MIKIKLSIIRKAFPYLSLLILASCVKLPDNVKAVDGFEAGRYLGSWYEIARLDHSFERGLSNVSATYELRPDGGVRVLNKGFNKKSGKWEQAEGKAYFVTEPGTGRLKVSFFGPFYGAYNIIDLDKVNYSYSMVCGPNRSYLWILSRNPKLDQTTLGKLIENAKNLGFETDRLIFVEQGGR
jgi:apolipoprotein D and lipocalin family protein